MKARDAALGIGIVVLAGRGSTFLAGCSLDFDRFGPVGDGGDPPGVDGGAGAPIASADAASYDGLVPCIAPPTCFSQAKSCGMTCAQQNTQCMAACQGPRCMQSCTSRQQSCYGTCASTCIDCTTTAGCIETGSCLTAAGP
jgi:hypothetical protein